MRVNQAMSMNVSGTQQALHKCLLHQNLIWECLPYWIIKFPKAGTNFITFKKKPLWPMLKNLCDSNGISALLEAAKS